MWAMEKLCHYLLEREFTARVDHKPLVAMMKNKLNIMMEGWIDTIFKFDFTTLYLPGEENSFADAFSRQFENEETIIKTTTVTTTDIGQSLLMEAEKRGKIIPSNKEELLAQVHALGHFGIETMFKQLWNKGYWWPKMRKDLSLIVKKCIACQRFNITHEGYHPMKSIEANHIWDHLEIDLIGPGYIHGILFIILKE